MSWTLETPQSDGTLDILPLPNDGVAHIVVMSGDTAPILVQELQQVHTELGRITVGPWGAKLEAADRSLSILPGHVNSPAAANDPCTAGYVLQPRAGERLEAVFLRHGDLISSFEPAISLTCTFAPKVQVTSSAADHVIGELIDITDGVAETPEEETEDEDPDTTVTNVKATQGKSQQPQATPQLSAQRSVVVQETPTIARINGAEEYLTAFDGEMEVDHSEPVENTPTGSPRPANHADAEPCSTARTGQSQEGVLEDGKNEDDRNENDGSTDNGNLRPTLQPKPSVSVGAIDLFSNAVEAHSGDTSLKRRHPEVRISNKRPSPATDEKEAERVGRSGKRAKRTAPIIPSDQDTQDSREKTIAVDTSRGRKKKTSEVEGQEQAKEASAFKSRKKRVEEVMKIEDVAEATPPRSQRGPQRSDTAATAEPYDGATPRVAISNSSLTETSQAVKFLKKQGGSFVESVKEEFNVLCVRDGDFRKSCKLLQAVATGASVVTDKWLLDSAKAGHFLSVDAYQPSAPKQENEWKFKLADVLGQAQTPFTGYTIHFTSSLLSTYNPFTEIEQVCKAAGAAKVTKKKMDKSKQVIVLAMDSHDKEADRLMEDGISCYNKDILPCSILRGTVDLDSDEFKITAGAIKETKKKRDGRKSAG